MRDETTERMREIAGNAVEHNCAECAKCGAVAVIWKEIGKMRDGIKTIETAMAEERGAAREAAAKNVRTVQILAGLAALSTVLGFILNHWPHK